MTGSGTPVAGAAVRAARPPTLWARLFWRRLREPPFWAIQTGVVSITVFHLAVEAYDIFGTDVSITAGLHHLPVVLYLAPVVFAGLRYGFEGAVLTGAWCITLTLPNILVWHPGAVAVAGELLYVSFVIGVGLAVAVPVERERQQRRRLALLNDVASDLVSSATLDRTLHGVLARLREVLGLEGAGIASWDPGVEGSVQRWHSALPAVEDRLREALAGPDLRWLRTGVTELGAGLRAAPVGTGDPVGALVVLPNPIRPLSREDEDLVQALAGQIGVALDNARLHRQERDRLRSYVQEVTRAQEEERKRLARELHDTAAQDLVRLTRGLDALEESQASDGGLRQRLRELRALAEGSLEGLRRVSRDLRPALLDDLGLVPALEWLVADLRQRAGIQAEFRHSGAPRRLDPETEVALFRITQEALRNVERHAGAARAVVEAEFTGDAIRVAVTDNGRGFVAPVPMEGLAQSGRLGLLGMYERAQLVGGTLAIRSRPGEGTRVSVEVVG